MARSEPGRGLPETTSVAGWLRSDEDGDYVPCGCGQAVQRPMGDVQAQVAAEYDAAGVDVQIERVFVCERDPCERRTVQRAADTDTEGNR